ncbi:hypothetical protein V3851_13235 [Paenibacillus sp. M1]|uniref:Uncharacterized protein n=1 Tax=Paenibacillus haidiansis TaxID=1574488 RepID=A0ABU7VSN3_9BACL
MEKQNLKPFKNLASSSSGLPTRISGAAATYTTKRKINKTNPSSNHGVMIVPPSHDIRCLIDQDMKRIQSDLIKEIGQEAYDKRRTEANEEFERLTGMKVRSK